MTNTVSRFEVNPVAGMVPSSFTSADTFTTDDKSEKNHFYFATDDENILIGVWECAPCKEVIESYPAHEMMTILAGSVTLTSTDDGHSETFTLETLVEREKDVQDIDVHGEFENHVITLLVMSDSSNFPGASRACAYFRDPTEGSRFTAGDTFFCCQRYTRYLGDH